MKRIIRTMHLNKMLSLILLCLLVIQSVVVWEFGSFGTMMVRQQEEESVDYILKTYRTNLNKALNKIESDLQDILSNQITLQMLKNRSDLRRWRASYNLTSLLDEKRVTTQDVDGYLISDTAYNTFLMARNKNIEYSDLDDIESFFKQIDRGEIISSGWTAAEINQKGYLLKYYNYGEVLIGAIVSQEKIQQILSYGQDTDTVIEFFVTNQEKEIICSSNPTWQYGQKIEENGTSVLREQRILDGEYFVMGSIQHVGMGAQTPYFFIILFFLILVAVLLLFLRFFMNREKIQQGNLMVRPSYECRNQEMLELKETYAMMLNTIIDLKVQHYEKMIQVKDSELKYMHMQLKPHFFLNALSTINSMAYQNKNEEIHDFIQVFSENIRYMFRTGLHTVPLKEEIAHVDKYLDMQKLLYANSFYAYYEMPEQLEKYPVPQMLLHTFVENIFKHVIDINSFTTIFIVCSLEEHNQENMLKIEVQNTGKCFEEEVLRRINGIEEDEDNGGGIGLMHTKEILSIMYGQNSLIWLENEEPEGSKVTVWIPEKVERDFHKS